MRMKISIIVLLGLTAGCALPLSLSKGQGDIQPPIGVPDVAVQSPINLLDPATCKSDHGVRVVPCDVDLTENQPNVKVTTKGPKGGTFTLNDTQCTSKDIAEIDGGNDHYVVSAGSIPGICTATFTDKEHSGKIIGIAKLKIAFYKREHCPPTC